MMENVGGAPQIKEGVTEHIWCVYDRDSESIDRAQISHVDEVSFDIAVQTAQNAGLNVAWSNDVFELWILLHFEDVQVGVWQHRETIYQRLTDIFRNMANQSPEMRRITSNPRFYYKETMKKKTNFIQHVRPYLATRREDAIQRAQCLEQSYLANTSFHQRNPCTKVHCLIDSIVSFY